MYEKYENELKEKADLIIVCYHGGFEKSLDEKMIPTESLTKENQGSELLEKFDSIDIILSGHQHRSFITKVNGVICSQPLNNGQTFTKIVLDTDTKEMSYELIDVSTLKNNINQDLEKIFTGIQSDLKDFLDTEIGHLDKDITIDDIFLARLEGHPFMNLLHQIQLDISNADFSAISLFDCAIGFKKNITIKDVLINYPFANTLKVLRITGEKLKEAIEKSATYFTLENNEVHISEDFLLPKVQNYNYDTYGGLTYEIDLTRERYDRVISMKKDNEDIDMEKYYTIVLSNYRASNTSVYTAYENAEVSKEINIDMSEIIMDYLQNNNKIELVTQNNYIIRY